jgi:hypothetical protein
MKSKKIVSLILPLNIILLVFVVVFYSIFDLGNNWKRILVIIGAVFLTALIEGVLIWLHERWDKKGAQEARRLAREEGLEVDDQIRHITYFDVDPKRLEEAPVTGYFLRHPSPKTSQWSLLRTKGMRGDFPNRWKWIVKTGTVSGDLKNYITELAADKTWSKTALEIEFNPDRVGAFWDEDANPERIKQLAEFLRRISSLAD